MARPLRVRLQARTRQANTKEHPMRARPCEAPAPIPPPPIRGRAALPCAHRDRLIVAYRPYVIKVARKLVESVSYHVEIDDLVGWGHMGLVEAAARFDSARGVTFRTFAHRRIQGAMFDGIRKHYGQSSSLPLYDTLVAEAALACELRSACADAAYEQVRHVLGREMRDAISEAMADLTPIERAIVHHHYFEGEPVKELTSSTKLSKSWLSRLHARALSKMRTALVARVRGVEAYL
jgi:RNA polymerase sigma factor for flagellar operon FliA